MNKFVIFRNIDIAIIKRIKKYYRQKKVSHILSNFDICFVYFDVNNKENIPLAFICIKVIDEKYKIIYMTLLHYIIIDNNLKINIMENTIGYLKNDNYKKIILECNMNDKIFYEKHNFIENGNLEKNMISMIKIL